MRVQRDIRDEQLARFLQTADEETLRAAMDELEADRELVAAIEHSERHDDPSEGQSVREFLDTLGDPN